MLKYIINGMQAKIIRVSGNEEKLRITKDTVILIAAMKNSSGQ